MVSTKTILSYLGNGILVGGTTYLALQAFEQFFFPKSEVYQIALYLVSKHPEAIKYLGEPITDEYINVNLSRDRQSNTSCYFSVPLRGPNATGTMRYLLTVNNPEVRDYHIAGIELFINNQEKTRISILDEPIPMSKQ